MHTTKRNKSNGKTTTHISKNEKDEKNPIKQHNTTTTTTKRQQKLQQDTRERKVIKENKKQNKN